MTVTAIAERSAVLPGDRLAVAVILDHRANFHTWPAQDVLPDAIAEFAIRTQISVPSPPAAIAALGAVQYPEPHPGLVANPTGRPATVTVPLYSDRAVAYLPVAIASDAPAGEVEILVRVAFQACDDKLCYIPEDLSVHVPLTILPAGADPGPSVPGDLFAGFDAGAGFASLAAPGGSPPPQDDPVGGPEEPETSRFDFFGWGFDLRNNAYLLILLVAFVAGALLNLTPCVLPIIPLKVMSLQKQAGNPAKLALFGTVYCLGIMAAFAVLAGLMVALKMQWGQLFSYPWFTGPMALLVAVMGVGMLGVFTVRLPQAVYMVNPSGDTAQGNFMLGMLTAVLSTPCTGPFLGAVLAWSGTLDAWLGFTATMMVGAGMAAPYALLIAFPKLIKKMPKSGPAGELLKQVLGLLMIAVAVFLSSNLVPHRRDDFWWAAGAVASAGFLWLVVRGAMILRTPRGKATGAAVGLLGIAASLGLAYVFTRPSEIPWRIYDDSDPSVVDAIAAALADPDTEVVAIKFTAIWCNNCHVVEKTVYDSGPGVRAMNRQGVVPIKIDLSGPNPEGWALLQKHSGGTGIPFSLFLRRDADPIAYTSFFKISDLERAILGEPTPGG